ncbi:MAG: hypothetical protein P1U90_06910 [Akkermansiaceae bacterium]|nr:hypothetical protein [Akkermansiaceae bacterium]
MTCQMKEFSPKFAVASTILVALAWLAIDYFRAFNTYNRFKENANSPLLELTPIDRKEQRFLDEVRKSWVALNPDEDFDGLMPFCEMNGMERSVEGLAKLLTYEIPPFSYWNHEKNLREVSRAGALSAVETRSIDGRLYYKEGVLFIRTRKDIVEYYEDTDQGVWFTFYGRVDQ